MTRGLRQGWDQLSLYLPVMLMGLLALGTWWLVRNAPAPLLPTTERAPTHQPDYVMKGFAVKSFDGTGRLQSEVKGAVGRHYPDTDTLEIDQVQMRSTTPQGRVTVATANRALSNADGTEVQLFGNAIVTRGRAWSSAANSCTPTPRPSACAPTNPSRSHAATTALPPTAWTTTTSTRCCSCAGACAACCSPASNETTP